MKISSNRIRIIFAEIIYLFLIAFFCYTAFNKMVNISSFRNNLMKTSLFSEEIANILSVIVIILEILIVLILLFNKKIGLLLFCGTMLIFTLYISYLRSNGLYEVCGCGGILNGLSYNFHLLINVFLILGSILSYYISNLVNNEK